MKNNHPHVAGRFVLVHNGVVQRKPAGIRLETDCDSEILVRVIERAGGVKKAYGDLMNLAGSFAIMCWDGEDLWLLRNEFSPACYVEYNHGIFVASTPEIMEMAARSVHLKIPKPQVVPPGRLFRILK
jgi:glucosamine 6-phosphate synthetase-like amidotransferase/phosphosugar isomerase protein